MEQKSEQPFETRADGLRVEYLAPEFELTEERIEAFLENLQTKGRSGDTLKYYRRGLDKLYGDLPAGKIMVRSTLERWKEGLFREGYSVQTVNSYMTAANGLLNFFGRRDLQRPEHLKKKSKSELALTRAEYLQLLRTAKLLGKERTYLLIKLFAFADLQMQDLPKVTVEAVSSGWIAVPSDGSLQLFHLPKCFREELLAYCRRRGVTTGVIFVKDDGKPMNRTVVSNSIRGLCEKADIPPEKGNPRCLRRLYHNTRRDIASQININALVDQIYDRMIETEQQSIGWGRE